MSVDVKPRSDEDGGQGVCKVLQGCRRMLGRG